MVTTVIVALVTGVVQVLLQNLAFGLLIGKRYLHGGAVVFAKAALYGAGIFVLLKFFRTFVIGAATGFGAGFFVTLAVVVIMRLRTSRRKGE